MNVIEAAIQKKVKRVVALSTDKAADPVNLYGGTKFIADKLISLAHMRPDAGGTLFSTVRYGNIIGSRGSVVIVFKQMIEEGVSFLPITDPKMCRFWLPLSDAISLVKSAFERMRGGEIFVAKVPSIWVKDLATALAPDLPQKTIGRRPGEKLSEVMISKDSSVDVIEFEKYYIIKPDAFLDGKKRENPNLDALGEEGIPVEEGFEYSSKENEHFLTVEEIKAGL